MVYGEGNLILTDVPGDADLVTKFLNTGSKTAVFSQDTTFTGNLGTFDVEVEDLATLTVNTYTKLTSKMVTGKGAVVIENMPGFLTGEVDEVDLTTITPANVTYKITQNGESKYKFGKGTKLTTIDVYLRVLYSVFRKRTHSTPFFLHDLGRGYKKL